MEIEGEDGSKISINSDSKSEFGRGLGFNFNDRSVSRHHIMFKLQNTPDSETRVYFEVLGKNPIWVYHSSNVDSDTKVFKRYDKGEMRVGDSFCVSAKNPILFKLKKSENDEEKRVFKEAEGEDRIKMDEEMAENSRSGVEESEEDGELGFGHVDVADIDPVKEFGFLVVGHEFDHFPKTKIRAIKDWDWFLEESRVDETEEATERKKSKYKKGGRRKKDEGDDEEWTGESEDEKDVISKVGKGKRPRYTTRSKDFNKSLEDVGTSKNFEQKKTASVENEEDDEDTLGGFIVNEEELEEEYNDDEEEEEEEEDFEDEDDD
ncbi:SMAD/FHA domain-containing protein [Thalictrum thalictroides]|uniref:SMAD/FHA domain-containing protein n=1 Tax=Thalictrum thalictroides TaxID=46969 RepID=A0A7J6UR74_THATH|nr:SMAD/FHA domain-containing protein [Thalictrum thalictroides]